MKYAEQIIKISNELRQKQNVITLFLINNEGSRPDIKNEGIRFEFYFYLSTSKEFKPKKPVVLGFYNGVFGQIKQDKEKDSQFMALSFLEDSLSNQLAVYLIQELTHSTDEDKTYLEDMILSMANYLIKRFCLHEEFSASAKMGIAPFKIKAINNHIKNNMDRNIYTLELAEIAKMSLHHFIRMFKQTTGQTPHQYVKRIKMEHAKALLLNSSENMVQVSLDVGCLNPSHFSQLFKSSYGMSPLRFRKAFQRKQSSLDSIGA